MTEQETQATWQGIIDSRPTVMYEDPGHITFRMRSAEGKFLEVFVPMAIMRQMPELFNRGRTIAITGETVAPGESPQVPFLVFADTAKAG
jgi:hypothetical protein